MERKVRIVSVKFSDSELEKIDNELTHLTKEEIIKVAKKININTIYMLGGNNEKD